MKPNIEYIRQIMKEHNWSNTQLAMKIGISRMEVSRLMRGVRVGGKKTIGGLIRAFPDEPLDKLFFLD
jgi:transcriptional regulator with XRE-family HTH domain